MFLSIITATYNRAHCLGNIYNSLLSNDRCDFEWIVVDDGSVDNTLDLLKEWSLDNKINLKYFAQQNAGKTLAVMRGFEACPSGEFTMVLDSDDVLIPGIIEKLKSTVKRLTPNHIGIAGLKSDMNGALIGGKFNKTETSYIDLYFGANPTYGDKLFIIMTELYRDAFVKPFPGEKFVPDNIPYIKMNNMGLFKCINAVVYKGDYLSDGMTSNVLKMAANNINGFIFEKSLLQTLPMNAKEKIKNEIKYISYSLAGDVGWLNIIGRSKNKFLTTILLAPSFLITFKRIMSIKKIREGNISKQ